MPVKPKFAVFHSLPEDPQAILLYEELTALGGDVVFVPFFEDEDQDRSIFVDSSVLKYKGIDLSDVEAVYIRSIALDTPEFPTPGAAAMELAWWRYKYLRENERLTVLDTLLRTLAERGCLVVNQLEPYHTHHVKTWFARWLWKNGCRVPQTLGVDSLDGLEERLEGCPKVFPQTGWVMKAAYGVGATRRVERSSLREERVRLSPVLLQEEIPGETVRVHTVGSHVVLALRVLADDIDSRSDAQGFEVVELPQAVQEDIRCANRLLGLHFSAWDILLDKDGNGFLVDCNPGPYILWIGSHYARYVMRRLGQYMIGWAIHRDVEKVDRAVCLEPPEFDRHLHIDQALKAHYKTVDYRPFLRIRY